MFLNVSFRLLRSSIEIFKKQTLEKTLELSQLKTDKEKLSAQVKSMQETVISKNQQYDIIAQKVRRLEEENSVVKKKLDRFASQQQCFDSIL